MSEFNDEKNMDGQEDDQSTLDVRKGGKTEPKGVMKQIVKDMGYQETDLIYEAFVTEEVQDYKEGFTIKTVIGAFFVAMIMTPGAIFLGLTVGGGAGGGLGGGAAAISSGGALAPAAQWTTVILFMEVARRSFTTLTKQEMYVLYAMAAMLVGGGPFTGFIWNQYLRQSRAASGFGIADDIPIWIVPPGASEALLQRTFLHRDWLPPLVLMIFSTVSGQMTYMGAGYLIYRLTADVERLPFPMAPVTAQGATALAETTQKKETWRWRVFSIGAMIGLAYGSIYVLIPGVTGAIMAEPLMIIPIPFIDLTPNVGYIAPAATLAISTDLGAVLQGFVIPFWATAASLGESLLTNFLLNPYLYDQGILNQWRPGMDVIQTQLSNNLDFYMSLGIGSAIAMAIIGIVIAIRYTLISKKEETDGRVDPMGRRRSMIGRGDIPVPLAITFWATAVGTTVYVAHKLVPEFPVLILIAWGFLWSPFDTYVSARLMGIMSRGITFPFIREATFILSGYEGVDIWFAPMPLYDHSGLAQHFKEVELKGTKMTSFFKLSLFVIPINLATSFMFWQFIWQMNPIPSAAYPFAQRVWPFNATMQLLWTTATAEGDQWLLEVLNARYIAIGAIGSLGLFGITMITRTPQLIFYGIVGGFGQLPIPVIPQFIGACINKFYLSKIFHPDRWRRYAMVLVAGYYAGVGLIGMASVGFVFIANAVTQMPY